TRRHLAQPATLRLWPTPNQFDKYFSRVILLATLGSVLYLFGCNSASTPSGTEYIGDWENARVPGVITTIRQQGDQFIVHYPNGTDSLATLKNGLLQFEGGGFYMYHKDADTSQAVEIASIYCAGKSNRLRTSGKPINHLKNRVCPTRKISTPVFLEKLPCIH